MRNTISVVDVYPVDTQAGDDTGVAIDMQAKGGFQAALAMVGVGAITGAPTTVAVSFEESDAADFGSGVTVVEGGEAVNVAADTAYQFQLARSKRYIRMNIEFTGGTTPSAEVHGVAVLNNWAKPFNIV